MSILAKAVGRRKEAVAQVQIKSGTGLFIINNKPAQDYLQNDFYSLLSVKAPFDVLTTSSNENLRSSMRDAPSGGSKNTNSVGFRSAPLTQITSYPLASIADQSSNDTAINAVSTNLAGDIQNTETDQTLKFDTIVVVKGGGLMGQTEAIRLGISRAICLLSTADNSNDTNTNETLPDMNQIRKQLKDKGYLTQDSRVKERRKYGLKKARKASQYHKR